MVCRVSCYNGSPKMRLGCPPCYGAGVPHLTRAWPPASHDVQVPHFILMLAQFVLRTSAYFMILTFLLLPYFAFYTYVFVVPVSYACFVLSPCSQILPKLNHAYKCSCTTYLIIITHNFMPRRLIEINKRIRRISLNLSNLLSILY